MPHCHKTVRRAVFSLSFLVLLVCVACGRGPAEPVFVIAGIPDQDLRLLEARFNNLATYLSKETGLDVQYVPSVDYAVVVTAFKQGDVQLAWYGGLTGVQARLAVPDAEAIAQRPRDAAFHSVFVATPGSGINSLADLAGKSFTFGSESSTSGHLMPRAFINEVGISPETDFTHVSYSGSHDRTWKLVEEGAFNAGALNEAVWQARMETGEVDLEKVDVFFRTPAYVDYHWVINREVDETYGPGTASKVRDALLAIDASAGGEKAEIAKAFQTDRFISTNNANYEAIEKVARELGIVE